jgi:hypothetical protein
LEEEEMVLNVASTHKVHFATKTEGRTVEREFLEIKHTKEGTKKKEKKLKRKWTSWNREESAL